MPPRDSGVTQLLHRASDDLTPDVDRLVTGGIARGRSRQRRARIGTTVASLAVIGVVGGLAAVVPQLGGPDSAPDPGIATDGGGVVVTATPTPTPAPSPDPDRPPPADELRPLVPTAQMARTIQDMTGASEVHEVFVDDSGKDLPRLFYGSVRSALVTFRIRWYNNPLVVEDGGEPLAPSFVCDPGAEVDCTTLADGSRLLREETFPGGGAGVPGSFLQRSLSLATADGWQIDVIAFNSTGEKEGVVVSPEPVLTMAEMEALATSDAWFG